MSTLYKPSQMSDAIKKLVYTEKYPDRPALPSGYQEVEYIGFDGASYTTINNRPKLFFIIVDAEQNELNTASLIFGFYDSLGHDDNFNFGSTGRAQRWYKYRASSLIAAPIEIEGKRVKSKAAITTPLTSKTTITVGCYNNSQYFKGKLYKLAMLNPIANSWARYWVPCYRASDGVIGLCDVVTNTFYTNEGSGSFTKGPDVN